MVYDGDFDEDFLQPIEHLVHVAQVSRGSLNEYSRDILSSVASIIKAPLDAVGTLPYFAEARLGALRVCYKSVHGATCSVRGFLRAAPRPLLRDLCRIASDATTLPVPSQGEPRPEATAAASTTGVRIGNLVRAFLAILNLPGKMALGRLAR